MTAGINWVVLGTLAIAGCSLDTQSGEANDGGDDRSIILQGPPGPRGPIGPGGSAGRRGLAGIAGERGARGEPGWTGPAGARGAPGAAGASGALGPEGHAGVQGPVGLQGAAGARGGVGPVGNAGAPGAEGPRGVTGSVAPAVCTWCHPGETACSADGKSLQRCVDDGDGCGHWEQGEVCDDRCDNAAPDKVDALGNRTYAYSSQCIRKDACSYMRSCDFGYTCVEGECRLGNPRPGEPGANCGNSVPCGVGERCDWNVCVASEHWLVASATLNAPDGLVHHFSALDAYGYATDNSYAWCRATPASYWNRASSYCGLSITTAGWTQSDLGPEYSGDVITATSLGSDLYGVGTYLLSSWDCPRIVADRLVTHDHACSLTVSEFVTGVGGYVAGTFEAAALVDDVSGQGGGTFQMLGSFRVPLR